jgi:hypothetical protein
MADRDEWGEKVLRQYKTIPWVLRQNSAHAEENAEFAIVKIVIQKEIRDFDGRQLNLLRHALAGFLNIDPEDVKVLAKKKGSIKLVIELPPEAAAEVLDAFHNRNADLQKKLSLFPVAGVEQVFPRASLAKPSSIEDNELLELVRKAIDALPLRQRKLITMEFIEELSSEEIRARLQLSEGAFRTAKYRAFKALRDSIAKTLEEYGGPDEA